MYNLEGSPIVADPGEGKRPGGPCLQAGVAHYSPPPPFIGDLGHWREVKRCTRRFRRLVIAVAKHIDHGGPWRGRSMLSHHQTSYIRRGFDADCPKWQYFRVNCL